MADFDLIVLGAGNAGLGAANVAHQAGWKVAVVENRGVGGTCPLRGCVPKKVLVAAAEVMDVIFRAGEHRITVDGARLDWARLIERKQTFVEGVPEDFRKSLHERGITVLDGTARFVGRTAVEVDGRRLGAKKIVIATGSRPRRLPFEGAEHLITSDDILDRTEQPGSLVFVGAGVISLELAHVLARAGTKVTLLEVMDRPLPAMDPGAVDQVSKATRELGVTLVTSVKVTSVTRAEGGFEVRYERDGEPHTVTAEVVVNGAGRVPAIDDLDLDAGEVERDRGIKVDRFLRSVSNPDVLVAGDALAGRPQLSPVATYEGKIAGHNAIGHDLKAPEYLTIPSCVFTVPALAQVGHTEDKAREAGLSFYVKENEMTSWRSARTYAESTAYAKVLVDKGSDQILGAHLVGHGAPETIHFFAMAMRTGVTAGAIKDAVYAYPTFHSDLKYLV